LAQYGASGCAADLWDRRAAARAVLRLRANVA